MDFYQIDILFFQKLGNKEKEIKVREGRNLSYPFRERERERP